jgi:hypothetical protein
MDSEIPQFFSAIYKITNIFFALCVAVDGRPLVLDPKRFAVCYFPDGRYGEEEDRGKKREREGEGR